MTLSAFRLSQEVLVIWMLSDPKKVSVSTEVDGRESERLGRMVFMEDVLFWIWRCRWPWDDGIANADENVMKARSSRVGRCLIVNCSDGSDFMR